MPTHEPCALSTSGTSVDKLTNIDIDNKSDDNFGISIVKKCFKSLLIEDIFTFDNLLSIRDIIHEGCRASIDLLSTAAEYDRMVCE